MNRIKHIIAYYRGRSPVTLLWHHGFLFVVVGALIIALRLTWAPWMPLFWPLLIWYLTFSFHFLLVRSLTANDDWADDRADKIRRNAYDFQHVKDIYIKPTNFEEPHFPPPEPDQSAKK
ncbi:MAG: hypothetical protein HQ502_12385 [Alphaproteobacteria bacterium]|nr:hypothetical protein [Alphaproteobacteria bacterium]